MYRIIVCALVLWYSTAEGLACDACSCGSAGLGSGSFTFQNRDYVGISFQQRSFQNLNPALLTPSHLDLQKIQLSGRYSPSKFVQFVASLPYHQNVQSGEIDSTLRGFGDASVMSQAVLWINQDSSETDFMSRFAFGGGVKLPTGKYHASEDGSILPDLQTGTGTLDLLLNANGLQRIYKWGILVDVTHKINRANANGYRFGDSWSSTAKLARWSNIRGVENVILQPEAGVVFSSAKKDLDGHTIVNFSGGTGLDACAGINVMMNNFYFGCTFSAPIRQDYAEGYLKTSNKFLVQFNYLFN